MAAKKFWHTAVSICAVLLAVLPSQVLAIRSEHQLVAGARYISDTTASGGVIRAVVADTTQVRVGMEGPAGSTSCSQSYNASDFDALQNQGDFVAAINALFIVDGKPSGDYIGNKVYLGPASGQWNVSVDHNGRIQVGNGQLTTENKSNYSMFMRGGYRIGQFNNKTFAQMNDEDVAARFAQIYASHPENRTSAIARTFLGVNEGGNQLILLTGGAGEERSRGITPMEGVNYLKTLGATEAFALDGGSSTFMRVKNELVGSNVNTRASGGGLDSILTVRTGRPLTQEQTNALPVLQCRDNEPNTTNPPVGDAPASQPAANPPGQSVTAGTSNVQAGALVSGAVPLEIPINGVTSITGEQNYILTYSRILFNFFAGIAGLLALLMLIVSGFQIIVGGPDQITKAKERIVGSIAGLVLLATSGFVLYLINPCFYSFSTTSACTPRGITPQEYQVPANGGTSGSSVGTTTAPALSSGHTADTGALARVNQLAAAHRALPPLMANPPSVPARSIAYPRSGGGYNFYTITDEDKLWMGRMIEYEGGANNASFGAELLWIVVQRFDWNSNRSGTFTHFMQAFSQPINPTWRRGGSHCPTVGAGSSISVQDACSERQLARRDQAAARTYESLSSTTRATVESFINGTLPNPVPGVVDFASNVRVEREGVIQTVGLGCSRSNLIFVRNKGAASGEPTDHSRDDCNANSDHLYAATRSGQSSLDKGYERIQVTRSAN